MGGTVNRLPVRVSSMHKTMSIGCNSKVKAMVE